MKVAPRPKKPEKRSQEQVVSVGIFDHFYWGPFEQQTKFAREIYFSSTQCSFILDGVVF